MAANHNKKEFKEMRAVIAWLSNNTCNNCKCFSINIEIHHIDKNSLNNSIFNLKPLCNSCHKLFHRIPIQPQTTKKSIIILLLRKVCNFS